MYKVLGFCAIFIAIHPSSLSEKNNQRHFLFPIPDKLLKTFDYLSYLQ